MKTDRATVDPIYTMILQSSGAGIDQTLCLRQLTPVLQLRSDQVDHQSREITSELSS